MMSARQDVLKIQSLRKAFSGSEVLKDVSFTAQPGVVTSLIGPNGAGKTTLFNIISGHLQADAGEVIFKGKNIVNLSPHTINRKGISRSFQIVSIFPKLTVFENVQMAVISHLRANRNIVTAAKKVGRREVIQGLDRIAFASHANTVAGTLSHGDQRVLEIAIALATMPDLLLLDEPTAGMNPEETLATIELIKKLARDQGLTVVLVEHDMDVVFSVSEKVVVLHNGMIISQGTPVEVRDDKTVQEVYLGEE
jgi:branched-chain amino acid transport system ATP-binding protein